jgi:hypothetical protein
MGPTEGATKKNKKRARQRQDRVLQRMLFFFRCHAHVAWHHRAHDDTPVRWHQCGGDPPLAAPRCTPPASPARGTASARDAPRGHTESARASAGFRGLSTAPSHTACPGHHRWDTFYKRRGQTVIAPPWVAVSLWIHRQGDACACRMGSLLHTGVAGLLGREH